MKLVHLLMLVCVVFMLINVSRDVQGMRPPPPPQPPILHPTYDGSTHWYQPYDPPSHPEHIEYRQEEDLQTLEKNVLKKTLGVKQLDAFPILGTTQPVQEQQTGEDVDELYSTLLDGDDDDDEEEETSIVRAKDDEK